MRSSGKYNEEIIQRAEHAYVEDGISLESISELSQDLLGMKVPFDTIKLWSKDYHWRKKKIEKENRGDNKPVDSVVDEVNVIRKIIFEEIVAKSRSGLMVTGDNIDEARVILDGIEGIDIREVSPTGTDSSLINSYMNLLSKAKVDFTNMGRSAKTTRQQVMDLAKKHSGGSGG